MRSVTAPPAPASGSRSRGKRSGAPAADADAVRPDPPAAAHRLGPEHRDRHDRRPGLERQPPDAAMGIPERAGTSPRPLGEDHDAVAALEDPPRRVHRLLVAGAAVDRERPEAAQQPAGDRVQEELLLRDVVDRAAVSASRSRTGRGSCGGSPRRSPARCAVRARCRCGACGNKAGRTVAGAPGRTSRRPRSRPARPPACGSRAGCSRAAPAD